MIDDCGVTSMSSFASMSFEEMRCRLDPRTRPMGLKRCRATEAFEDPISQNIVPVGTEIIVLPCGHSFACDGILHWLKQSPHCPVCRYHVQ